MSAEEPLDALLAGVREEVRARADAGGRVRDFAAMIGRAHALDPAAVSDDAVAEAARFARVVALRAAPSVREDREPAAPRRRGGGWLAVAAALLLVAAGLAGAVRSALPEAEPREAHAAPLVGPAQATREAPPGAGRGAPAGGGERAAAEAAGGLDRDDTRDMCEESVDESGATEVARGSHGEVPGGSSGDEGGRRRDGDKDMSEETLVGSTGTGGGSRPRVTAPAMGRLARRGAAPGGAEWEALDRAAREAWRRGDTGEARALLTALVRADAEASRVELAYGDLFVLARQADDAGELARLWRAYLVRFPRGLYAEDARAGLCRRARGAERRACWELYLETWPEGAHAGEAREAL